MRADGEDDRKWYPIGLRKGTSLVRTHKDYKMQGFDLEA